MSQDTSSRERKTLLKAVATCWRGVPGWNATFLDGERPAVRFEFRNEYGWKHSRFLQLESDACDAAAIILMLDEMERADLHLFMFTQETGKLYYIEWRSSKDSVLPSGNFTQGPTRALAVAKAFVAVFGEPKEKASVAIEEGEE